MIIIFRKAEALTLFLVWALGLVLPDLLDWAPEGAASPRILTGNQGALTPVPGTLSVVSRSWGTSCMVSRSRSVDHVQYIIVSTSCAH